MRKIVSILLGISILTTGSNYDAGSYSGIALIGGTGDSATVGIEVDGFGGSYNIKQVLDIYQEFI